MWRLADWITCSIRTVRGIEPENKQKSLQFRRVDDESVLATGKKRGESDVLE
jgi:hypothetical protein